MDVSDTNYELDNRLNVLSRKHRYKKDTITNDYKNLQRELSREYKVGTINEASYRTKKATYVNQESSDLRGENLFYTQDTQLIKQQQQKLIAKLESNYKRQVSVLTKEHNQRLKELPTMRAKHAAINQEELNSLEGMRQSHSQKIDDYKSGHEKDIAKLNETRDQDLIVADMRYKAVKLKLTILEQRRDNLESEHEKLLNSFGDEIDKLKLAQNRRHTSQIQRHNDRISEQGKIHASQNQGLLDRKSQVKKEYAG
jgi:hypothetical protein